MRNVIIITFLVHTGLFSQEYLNTIESIHKTNEQLTLDGLLNETLWSGAKSFPFIEWRTDWGKPDSLTTLFITFDDDYLYVALDAKDPHPEKIISRNLVRDGWYGDDYFAFQIDPNSTKKNAFVFSIYPSGSRYDDAIYNDNVPLGNAPSTPAYDMLWEGKTQITDDGWQAEYRIPLSNLRFEIRNGEVLGGISAHRTINYENKLMAYPKVPQNITGGNSKPSLKKPVRFVGLQPKKDLQITPYLLTSTQSTFELNAAETSYEKDNFNELDVGLDVRYGITPSLTLDLTLNTDFSQVEIDDQIVNLGRVSIFFPERRKFFLQQSGLFDFDVGILSQLFYSRTIGINNGRLTPILGGAKLTGELGNWDIGLLSLQTEGTQINSNALPTENFSVLRLRRKVFNDRSFIGLMATNRIREGYINTALGIDGVINISEEDFIITSLATTIDGDNYSNANFNLTKNSRFAFQYARRKQDGWFGRVAYEYSGENFNPGMGFLLREKHHNFYAGVNHGKFNSDQEKHMFQYRRWMPINSDIYFTTEFSDVLTWYNRSQWTGRFFNNDQISFFGQVQYEFLQEPLQFSNAIIIPQGDYFYTYFGASYSSAFQKALKIPISAEYGSFFDGENLQFELSPEWSLNEHFTLTGSWRINYLNFNNRNVDEWINVPQLRLNWAYDLHLSGSITAQYNSINNQVFASTRLRYNFKDGHNLYAVFNQDYNTERNLFEPMLPRFNSQLLTVKYLYTFY
ncbi:DUF5916 domain-containing protein [Flagellimonas sp. CMM7]|uniref:DUF5916 domain-containing protein n=1 Tax=Flagellimonas sp. CMM7 TaxID=2654676 RepID=UPI0013D3BFD3|nr:DUF5916 domain-containing protein [Flagellimonas sp. CMM7]UII81415.1 carbohydrate binding family 9 domain-containing protein [Flagellimonas sp. CMM7]